MIRLRKTNQLCVRILRSVGGGRCFFSWTVALILPLCSFVMTGWRRRREMLSVLTSVLLSWACLLDAFEAERISKAEKRNRSRRKYCDKLPIYWKGYFNVTFNVLTTISSYLMQQRSDVCSLHTVKSQFVMTYDSFRCKWIVQFDRCHNRCVSPYT